MTFDLVVRVNKKSDEIDAAIVCARYRTDAIAGKFLSSKTDAQNVQIVESVPCDWSATITLTPDNTVIAEQY